jgi:hypothetical protein
MQRIHEALSAIAAEAEDPDDRHRRYARQAALLNLLILVDGIVRFHASKRRANDVAALRDLVADALRPLVPED